MTLQDRQTDRQTDRILYFNVNDYNQVQGILVTVNKYCIVHFQWYFDRIFKVYYLSRSDTATILKTLSIGNLLHIAKWKPCKVDLFYYRPDSLMQIGVNCYSIIFVMDQSFGSFSSWERPTIFINHGTLSIKPVRYLWNYIYISREFAFKSTRVWSELYFYYSENVTHIFNRKTKILIGVPKVVLLKLYWKSFWVN